MFLDNKYTKWYYNIVANAQNRVTLGYIEKHHIIPKSIGGNDSVSNIVALTAREHFICHLLLTKMTTGIAKRKAIHAAWGMSNLKGPGQQRYRVSSAIYEELKIKNANELSKLYTGVKNSKKSNPGAKNGFYGKSHSEETKEKIRRARLGSKDSNEVRIKKSIAGKQKPSVSIETRQKLSVANKGRMGYPGEENPFYGKKHSEESRKRMSESHLAEPKKVCYHCNKIIDVRNFGRWHGDNCKYKQ
jgi:hypothetical protein